MKLDAADNAAMSEWTFTQCEWSFCHSQWYDEGGFHSGYRQCSRHGFQEHPDELVLCWQHQTAAMTRVIPCHFCWRLESEYYIHRVDIGEQRLVGACRHCTNNMDIDERKWGDHTALSACPICARLRDTRTIKFRSYAGENRHWYEASFSCKQCFDALWKQLRTEQECRNVRRFIKSLKEELRNVNNQDDGAATRVPGVTDGVRANGQAQGRRRKQNHQDGRAG